VLEKLQKVVDEYFDYIFIEGLRVNAWSCLEGFLLMLEMKDMKLLKMIGG
jgi:hypothetical protein